MDKKLKLTFAGGAGAVTGSNFLVEGKNEGKEFSFLVDCGLSQGSRELEEKNWEKFIYDPSKIDFLFVTHAHIDHIGRIPKLIHDGFNGKIISTIPTKDLSELMLQDTANIITRDDNDLIEKIYSEKNLEKVFDLWTVIDYKQDYSVGEFIFRFRDAGHILGSGMLEVIYNNKKIVFTGDLGNSPSPLLRDTDIIKNVDYLIMESVYGDRNHTERNVRRARLEKSIEDNHKKGGVLLIPTFSLERSQELLFEINELVENNRVPIMPIFFDSPLAIRLTKIYKDYTHYFNALARKMISEGDDIFNFTGLKQTLKTEDSKEIIREENPKIIIAGSGMSNGGRILHHHTHYLPDPSTTLVLTGYQTTGTLGRLIQDGAKQVRINGQDVSVNAHVTFINGYSGHKDSDGLVDFVSNTADTLNSVYVVMGEPKSALFLTQRLRDYLGVMAYAPEENDVVELDCN